MSFWSRFGTWLRPPPPRAPALARSATAAAGESALPNGSGVAAPPSSDTSPPPVVTPAPRHAGAEPASVGAAASPVDAPLREDELSSDASAGPSRSADAFRQGLLAAVRASCLAERAELYPLDPTVHLLVVPPTYDTAEGGDPKLARDLEESIQGIHNRGRPLASLTWTALRDAKPTFAPSYEEWAGDDSARFAGNVGLIFFLDIEGMALAMMRAAQELGFHARYEAERPTVVVQDGRFESRISVHALVAEALWTARGPRSVIRRRARALPGEFRGYLATLGGLSRRFPGVRFDLQEGVLHVRGTTWSDVVPYQQLTQTLRAAGLGIDAWLARVSLFDVLGYEGEPALLLRSPLYPRAFPHSLHEGHEGHCVVAVRIVNERAAPLLRTDEDPPERFAHCIEEAGRRLGARRFEGYAFLVESGAERVAVFVGDGMASVALHASLVRGVLEHAMVPPARARVRCLSEDVLLLAPAEVEADHELWREASRMALLLEGDLSDDRVDRLQYDTVLELDAEPAGHFELQLVPFQYFDLREDAEDTRSTSIARAERLRGIALELIGRPEQAAEALARSLRHDQDDGESQLALGRVLNELGRHPDAVPVLRSAARALHERADAQNALGIALYLTGAAREAAAAFERAVALDPADASLLVNLGRCYYESADFEQAQSAWERALELEPASAEVHASLAQLCHEQGDATGAIRHAREALSEEPDNADMQTLLAEYGADR